MAAKQERGNDRKARDNMTMKWGDRQLIAQHEFKSQLEANTRTCHGDHGWNQLVDVGASEGRVDHVAE
jgi:hypothetical protein